MTAMQTQEAASGVLVENQTFRLPGMMLAAVVDVARGVEEGESGLKSCALGALVAADAGAKPTEINIRHHREVEEIEDEDEYLNALGDLLAKGFSFDDAFKSVQLATDGVNLLALERWCQRAGLRCSADEVLPTPHATHSWKSSLEHYRRRRARRALAALRDTTAGTTHAAVLHVVYGWPDPFLRTLEPEARSALGAEYGPLARYTDAVEAKRQELVEAEADRVPDPNAFGHWFATRNLKRNNEGGIAQLVANAAEVDEMHRLAVIHKTEPTPQVFELELRRSRLAWADRCISSGDALRAGTDPKRTRASFERSAFISAIRIDANRMLSEASRAFVDAWNRS